MNRQNCIELIRQKVNTARCETVRLIAIAGSGHGGNGGTSFSCLQIGQAVPELLSNPSSPRKGVRVQRAYGS